MIQVFYQVTHVQGHEGELTYDQQSFLQDSTKVLCEKHTACRSHAKFPSVFYVLSYVGSMQLIISDMV